MDTLPVECHQGFGLTADDARADDNYALRYSATLGHLSVLQYLG
jgi:hypothetical protein